MIVSKDIEFYRARLLNLADTLEKLPEEKGKDFIHSIYIDTGNMCSTSACVAGWAVILHTEEGKKISDFQKEIFKYVNKKSSTYYKMREEFDYLVSHTKWMSLGMKVLGIGEKTAEKLFLPLGYFWSTLSLK